ncbi:hypothetical protein LT85_0493 [Collimonas arenae]|uniref:Type III secretion protein n=2 Tax=Collimonas arenae TaxID=279058 RepID=A0A0A1F4K6_9BURK|nr:hypothetical protein LT85_0493 [Collimonas arenae]
MFAQSMIDWWFMPWSYALQPGAAWPPMAEQLGSRDRYRLWCRAADVVADFPAQCDSGWGVASISDGAQLLAAARLFAGLLAAREHDNANARAALLSLSPAERKWCLSVAATQPLRRFADDIAVDAGAIGLRGLLELALYLHDGFPGMWSRLRLTLPSAQAAQVDTLLKTMSEGSVAPAVQIVRAQRCWRMCLLRVAVAGQADLSQVVSESR